MCGERYRGERGCNSVFSHHNFLPFFSANITTLAAPPSQPPANLGGGGGKVGVLTITWDPLPLASQNGPGVGYVVNWKEANMVDEQWDEVSGFTLLQ